MSSPPRPDCPTSNRPDVKPVNFWDRRSLVAGVLVIIGGGLMMELLLGVAAIAGMLSRGLSPEMVEQQLQSSWSYEAFAAAGLLLVAVLGGYVAGRMAAHAPLRHAMAAGLATVPLHFGLWLIVETSAPAWVPLGAIVLLVPCAAVGGYGATPVLEALEQPQGDG